MSNWKGRIPFWDVRVLDDVLDSPDWAQIQGAEQRRVADEGQPRFGLRAASEGQALCARNTLEPMRTCTAVHALEPKWLRLTVVRSSDAPTRNSVTRTPHSKHRDLNWDAKNHASDGIAGGHCRTNALGIFPEPPR